MKSKLNLLVVITCLGLSATGCNNKFAGADTAEFGAISQSSMPSEFLEGEIEERFHEELVEKDPRDNNDDYLAVDSSDDIFDQILTDPYTPGGPSPEVPYSPAVVVVEGPAPVIVPEVPYAPPVVVAAEEGGTVGGNSAGDGEVMRDPASETAGGVAGGGAGDNGDEAPATSGGTSGGGTTGGSGGSCESAADAQACIDANCEPIYAEGEAEEYQGCVKPPVVNPPSVVSGCGCDANPKPKKVLVCHQQGNGGFHTINISCNALKAHLGHHNDVCGACPAGN